MTSMVDEDIDLVIVNSDDPLPCPLDLDNRNRVPIQSERVKLLESFGRRPSRRRSTTFATFLGSEVEVEASLVFDQKLNMKPNVVVDEMFPEGAGPYVDVDEAGGSSGILMDLAANEKSVHTDFFHQFDDLYDDEDLS